MGGIALSAGKTLGLLEVPEVPAVQRESVKRLIEILMKFFKIARLGGHREFPEQLDEGKICPGNHGIELVKSLRAKLNLEVPVRRCEG